MIDINTRSFEYSLYNTTGYLSVKENNSQDDSNFIYAGYSNGITPFTIPLSEWEALGDTYPGDPSYSRINGNISGFYDSDSWHTPLHIIGGDGLNYAIGISVWYFMGYNFTIYYYDIDWGVWRAGTYIRAEPDSGQTAANAYNKLPDFVYIGMYYTTSPYVNGAIYFYDRDDGDFHYYADNALGDFIGSTDTATGTIPTVTQAPEAAPDPYNPIPENEDPYREGGTTTIGGGEGTFALTGDSVDFPGLPSAGAVDTGFITLFNPSISQLNSLANYMWSGAFDLSTYKKIFADPMDCILGLSIVPVSVPNGGSGSVTVGNISTGVSMTKAASQYVEVDCGSIEVKEFWGAYLDYAPYTKAEIYLPYCGTHPLNIDDIMKKTIHVKYHVDILSGACCAYVKCGTSVLYSFLGQCSSSIPITGNDWTNVINGVLNIASSVGILVASGGMSAPVTAAAGVNAGASTATNVMNMKPSIEKSGAMGGTGGMLGIQKPYLILTVPRQALPKTQNKFTGYPSYITASLSGITGYTEIYDIHLEGVPATDAEIDEIVSLLKGGVIL